jgi:phosphoglycolate phosphatase-like HAD superfamily hydrolase
MMWLEKISKLSLRKVVPADRFILDFDGTIADTMPGLTELATRAIVQAHGLNQDKACGLYLATIGATFEAQLNELFPDERRNNEDAARFYNNNRELVYREADFCETAREACGLLKKKDVRIVSSTPSRLVEKWLNRHDLNFRNHTNQFGGQKREQVRAAAATARQVVFIGDAPRDLRYVLGTEITFYGVEHTMPASAFSQSGSLPTLLDVVRRLLA